MKILNFISKILDCIYYRKCYICSKKCLEISVCKDCLDKIYSELAFAKIQKHGLDIFSGAVYEGELLKIIRALKYHKKCEFSKILSEIIIKTIKNYNINTEEFTICPVPIHASRMKKRKYNHMELVAQEVASAFQAEVCNGLITRIKDTEPLYKLSIPERKKVINGAFEVSSEVRGKKIMLIDDIVTSGTTISEIAKLLKEKEVEKIIIISATRAKSFL